MVTTHDVRRAFRFAGDLWRVQALTAWHGRVHRDAFDRLRLREGHEDPYRIYEQLRPLGPLTATRLGNLATVDHATTRTILSSRSFGMRALTEGANGFDLSFLERNDPEHARLRGVAAPAFSPRMVRGYRTRIEGLVDDLVVQLRTGRPVDFVSAFAAPLPLQVMTHLFGIDDGLDNATLVRCSADMASALDGVQSLRHARRLINANAALRRLFQRLIDRRTADSGDDLISELLGRRGDRVSAEELVSMCTLLLATGVETTANLLGNALLALQAHPDQWRLLVERPELAGQAIEETLRWNPPVQRTERLSLEDQEVAGTPVRQGQSVLLLIGGTGRDPRVFTDPDRFDVTRTGADHLAFSSGIHYCIGAPLARLEATIGLEQLARRVPDIRRAGRVTMRSTTLIRGPLRLPVTV